MQALFEYQHIIFSQFNVDSIYHRSLFDQISLDNYVTGIVGSRGVGKTTLLLREALKQGAEAGRALYVSADNLFFLKNTLLSLVDQLYKETDVRLLCIDEIHKYPAWTQELKNIADIYPSFRLLFSGSSSIDLIHGRYDLSRRVTLLHLRGLSFREYLEFTLKRPFPKLDFATFPAMHLDFAKSLNLPEILKHFKTYLSTGYYPFFRQFKQDWEKFQTIEHIVQKTIYEDVALFKSMKTQSLGVLERLYKYVLSSPPGELSAFKLANALGKDFETISDYLSLLEQAGLIRFLWSRQTGKAALRNPLKIYPDNTNLIYAAHMHALPDDLKGKVRETFVMNQLQNAQIPVYYTETGDFQGDHFIFEVGGKNKTSKQIQGLENAWVVAEGVLLGSKNTLPLYLLGFLE